MVAMILIVMTKSRKKVRKKQKHILNYLNNTTLSKVIINWQEFWQYIFDSKCNYLNIVKVHFSCQDDRFVNGCAKLERHDGARG